MRRLITWWALFVLAAALAGVTRAQQAPAAPSGKIVLTISGTLAGAAKVEFDMAALEKLPQQHFTTAAPWFSAPRTFTGPLLRDVLAAAGARGTTLRAVALNDYKIEIPADDAQRFDVIVARLMNGRPMAVRDKGPLFIVYPFDSRAELRSERYYSRSAWQLRSIEVR